MRKETTRYKMNRFLSEMPLTKVSFQSDVSKQDLPAIQSYLNRLCANTSLTLIVIENHTQEHLMKTFTEFVDDEAELNESIIRTAAIASFAAASRQHADKLEMHAKSALRHLQRPTETDTDRLKNIESALAEIANALIESRHQSGSHVAMNLSASLLMSRAMKDILDTKNRRQRR